MSINQLLEALCFFIRAVFVGEKRLLVRIYLRRSLLQARGRPNKDLVTPREEFQEKKHELVSKGTELSVAQGIVARDERKRLEHVAAQRAAPCLRSERLSAEPPK